MIAMWLATAATIFATGATIMLGSHLHRRITRKESKLVRHNRQQDEAIRIADRRANPQKVQAHAFTSAADFQERGAVLDDGFWVDPVSLDLANAIVPRGFTAFSSCLKCQNFDAHLFEEIKHWKIVRRCSNCGATWEEMK